MLPSKTETSRNLAFLRKESLDIYNRIHSIAEDIFFVDHVRKIYPDYPLIPNLRCGAWYVDPALLRLQEVKPIRQSAGQFAYFKSTDGHFSNWSFNLRRPNLHLLSMLVDKRGAILVDSTRAGKRMPDALSKTVPIWCAVVNRAICRLYQLSPDSGWDTTLYTPPGTVSAQEHHQIEQKIDSWADFLVSSSYTLPHLKYPLRPLWITPSTSSFPSISDQTYIPIICVSASKQIEEGFERRSNGFAYVQGSGDDHELWGMGLTPDIFWSNKELILQTDRADLENLISTLVFQETAKTQTDSKLSPPTPIMKVHGQISLTSISDLPNSIVQPARRIYQSPSDSEESSDTAYIIIGPGHLSSEIDNLASCPSTGPGNSIVDQCVLRIALSDSLSSRTHLFSHTILPGSTSFIHHHLSLNHKICIACPTGKDFSVGVAIVALQLFFDNDGNITPGINPGKNIDKSSIRTRLQWIITSRPQANPSRSTLKRVNEFLMSHNYNPNLRPPQHS